MKFTGRGCAPDRSVNSSLVTARTTISHLPPLADGTVRVSGWVDTVRDQKKVQFVVLRDESGAVQLVHPVPEERDDIAETISGLNLGDFVSVEGELKHDERVKLGGIEVKIGTLDVVTKSLAETPIADDSGV